MVTLLYKSKRMTLERAWGGEVALLSRLQVPNRLLSHLC